MPGTVGSSVGHPLDEVAPPAVLGDARFALAKDQGDRFTVFVVNFQGGDQAVDGAVVTLFGES